MSQIAKKMQSKVSAMTTAEVVEGYEIAAARDDSAADAVLDVLMFELDSRNHQAFINWSLSGQESPRAFFA